MIPCREEAAFFSGGAARPSVRSEEVGVRSGGAPRQIKKRRGVLKLVNASGSLPTTVNRLPYNRSPAC